MNLDNKSFKECLWEILENLRYGDKTASVEDSYAEILKATREVVRLEVVDVGRCESICNCGEEIYKQICDKLEV